MKVLALTFALLAGILFALPAMAHTLKRDGSVGAVLHITPNDDPVAGEEAVIGFSISDSQKKFSTRDCNCSLLIHKDGNTLSTISLPNSLESRYTFPTTGQYTLRLVGTSKTNSFASFQIDQSIRITSSGTSYAIHPISKIISALILSVILVVTSLYTYSRHQHYAPIMNSRERKKS